MAVQSGAAALDVLGPRRRRRRGCSTCTPSSSPSCAALWGDGRVAAEVRLAAAGRRAPRAPPCARAPPARRAELPRPRRPPARPRQRAVCGAGVAAPPPDRSRAGAWAARVEAEHERARWAAGDDVAVEGLVATLARGRRPLRRARRPLRGGPLALRGWPRCCSPRATAAADEVLGGGPRHGPRARCRAARSRSLDRLAPAPPARRADADRPRGRGARRWSPRVAPTARSAGRCSSAPRRRACTSPTSSPSSARHRAARPWRWPAPRACSTTERGSGRPARARRRRRDVVAACAARGCRWSARRRAGSPRACGR